MHFNSYDLGGAKSPGRPDRHVVYESTVDKHSTVQENRLENARDRHACPRCVVKPAFVDIHGLFGVKVSSDNREIDPSIAQVGKGCISYEPVEDLLDDVSLEGAAVQVEISPSGHGPGGHA